MNQLRRKLWMGIGAFVIGASPLDMRSAGAAPKGEGGEGGEGGERGPKHGAQSRVDWLTALGLVEGHLHAAMELLRAGAQDAAKVHAKHPSDEIYSSLKPGFKRYGAAGFAAELDKLAKALNSGDRATAEKAFAEVTRKIDLARRKAPANAKTQLQVVAKLLETAADEYRESIKDGKIADPKEYQDAFGFTHVAGNLLKRIAAKSEAERSAVASAQKAVADLGTLWPSLPGNGAPAGDPASIAAAGSRIELSASGLR